MKKYILFLPVEISTRELDAKLLVALAAAQEDFTVVIGSVQTLFLASLLKCGIVFYKDASAPLQKRFSQFKAAGVKVVVHDEEGFVHLDDRIYMNARLKFNTIRYVDLFFAWGRHQAAMIAEAIREFSSSARVAVVGHPRIDLLRRPFNNPELPENIILINTKLAEYNHRLGPNGWIEILERHSMIIDDHDRAMRLEQKAYKEKLFYEYQTLINLLSQEFKNHRIVIRPHPVENKQVWIDFAAQTQNVEVCWDGTISEWVRRSQVVIHTGCTTGIEAAIIGRPVISYKPIDNSKFDIKLPDSVSDIAHHPSEVISHIHAFEARECRMSSSTLEILDPHIHNLRNAYSYEQIVAELTALRPISERKAWVWHICRLFFFVRDILKKYVKDRRGLESIDPKFKTSIQEVKDKIHFFSSVTGISSTNIVVTKFSDEIYVIEKQRF